MDDIGPPPGHPDHHTPPDTHFFEDRELPADQANPTPSGVVDSVSQVFDFLGAYGWYLILGLIALFYLKSKYSSKIQGWQSQRQQEDDLQRYDETTVLSRQEAMEKARQRMQEEHNEKAAEHSVRQQEREEEKRKQELEDWERHKAGRGYKSKIKNRIEEPLSSPGAEGGASRPKKKLMRDDYNPLMGAGAGAGFRPARRGLSGGG